MAIRDLARESVVTVAPDDQVTAVAGRMDEDGVGSVVVVEDGAPVGIITDRDLAMEVVAAGADPADLDAAAIMTPDPFTVEADEGIYEVLDRTTEVGVRRVPVVEDGRLVGIVTLDDFIVLLASELGQVSDVVQGHSPPY